MTALFSIIILLIGLLLYALPLNAKVNEVGRVMMFCGLLVALFQLGAHSVRLP